MITLPENYNFVAHVLDCADPAAVAMSDPTQTITYGQLLDRVQRMAYYFHFKGLKTEQRVAIVRRDGVDTATMILAVMYYGAVAVPLDPRSTPANLDYCLKHCGASVVLDEDTDVSQMIDRDHILQRKSTHRDSAAIFMYTSGTTGHPKAVVHRQATPWIIGITAGQRTLDLQPSDVTFATAKLFFSFGLFNLWNTLVAGASVYFNPGISMPGTLAEIVRGRKPTVMISVPVLWGKLARQDIAGNQLRLCLSGGDRLPETLCQQWQERTGLSLNNLYGSTETGTAFTYNDGLGNSPGSIGRAVEGYDLEIRDSQLWVRAPSAGLCYWHDQYWSARQFGEWMPTGDIVSQDEQGYYHYLGRASDVIKVNGRYVDLGAIEHMMLSYPGVTEAVVVGKQDDNGQARMKAYVVTDAEIDPSALRNYVRINSTDFPREIKLVESLPRTDTGKVQRYKLRQLM